MAVGQKIPDLDPVGTIDYSKSDAHLFELALNSGTIESPEYEIDASRKITSAELRDIIMTGGAGSGLHYSDGKTNLGGTITEDVFINGAFDFTLSNLSQFGAYLNESANIVVSTENFSNQLNILASSIALTYQNNDNGAKAFLSGNDSSLNLFWLGASDDYSGVKMNAFGIGIDSQGGDVDKALYFRSDLLSVKRTQQAQDRDGTLALLDDILGKYLPVTDLSLGKYKYAYSDGGIVTEELFGDAFNKTVTKAGFFKTEFNQEFNRIRLALFEDPDAGFSGEVGVFDSFVRMAAYNPTMSHTLTLEPDSIKFKRVDGANFELDFDLSLMTSSFTGSIPNKTGPQIFAMISDILGSDHTTPKTSEYWISPDNTVYVVSINNDGILVSTPY